LHAPPDVLDKAVVPDRAHAAVGARERLLETRDATVLHPHPRRHDQPVVLDARAVVEHERRTLRLKHDRASSDPARAGGHDRRHRTAAALERRDACAGQRKRRTVVVEVGGLDDGEVCAFRAELADELRRDGDARRAAAHDHYAVRACAAGRQRVRLPLALGGL
jgi:hypothetical protein